MSFRRRALFLAGLFVAVSCSDAGNPLGPTGPEQPAPGALGEEVLAVLTCTVNVRTGSETCGPAQPAAGDALLDFIAIGNAAQVTLTTTNTVSTATSLSYDRTITNNIPQALGTVNGSTADDDSVRVWVERPFMIDTAVAGQTTSVTVANPDGTLTYKTYTNRPFFRYPGLLQPGETSPARNWQFTLVNVDAFSYKVFVLAEVQFPKGWIDITPDNPVIENGAVDTFAAHVRGPVGNVHSDTAGLTWISTNPSVVAVVELSPRDTLAQITAHGEGTAWIKVRSSAIVDSLARRDSVLVTVNNKPVVPLDSINALTNVAGRVSPTRLRQGLVEGDSIVPNQTYDSGHGNAVINAAGELTYVADPGYFGQDTVLYDVTDGEWTVKRTLLVNVAPSNYWFVREGASGGGSNTQPLGSINAASDSATAGDTIFVLRNGSNDLVGAHTLDAGEALIGAGVPTAFEATGLNEPGHKDLIFQGQGVGTPLVNTGAPTLTLSSNNLVRGVNISSVDAAAIHGVGFGTLTVGEVIVQAGGPALSLVNGNLAGLFTALHSLNSDSAGLTLQSVGGSLVATASSISGAATAAISVTGGSVDISFPGDVTHAGSGRVLNIVSHSGPATFQGAITATAGTGMLFSAAAGTYTLNGAVTLAGGDAGLDLAVSDGVFTFANASVSNPTGGPAVHVVGGTPAMFYRGSITHNTGRAVHVDGITADSVVLRAAITSGTAGAPTGLGILVQNVSGGLVALDSVKSLFTATNPAVTLSNAGGMVRLGHAMGITTTTGAGFTASGAGTVSVTGANTVATGTGIPVSLTSVNTGTAGVSFSSISTSAGATNGIVLNGISGAGFQGTGGTVSATTGPAVLLTNTNAADSVSLRGMTFSRSGGTGAVISGSNFGKLHALNTSVTATGGPGALALATGTMSGTYSTVSSNASTGSGVSLTGVNGTFNASGGSINTAGAAAFLVSGGSVSGTISGTVAQASAIPLLSVSGGHETGTEVLTFAGNVTATNGNGLQFDNADGRYFFTANVSLQGGDAGIDITNNSAGEFNFPTTSDIVSPSTGNLVSILNSAPTFTYSGAFTKANNNVTGIFVSGNTGGSIIFNGTGTKSISSGTAAAVNLVNNTGTTITFAGGGLTLTSGSGTGFNATGGGTVNVKDGNNTVGSTGGGTPVNIQNTTIGGDNVTFRSVNKTTGSGYGIRLENTGTSGGLKVTGDGSSANSGGTITQSAATNADSAAVTLTSTGDLSLQFMRFSITTGDGSSGIVASGLTGTNLVQKSTVDFNNVVPAGVPVNAAYGARFLQNTNATITLDAVTMQNKLDGTTAGSLSAGGTGIVNFNVIDSNTGDSFGSTLQGLFGSGWVISSGDTGGSTGTVNLTISDSRFQNAAANGTNNLELGANASSTFNYKVKNNLFSGVANASFIAGIINMQTFDTAVMGGNTAMDSITGNTITNSGTSSAVTDLGYVGIRVALQSSAATTHRLVIHNNQITELWRQGLLLSTRQSATGHIKVVNNTIGTPAAPVGQSGRRGLETDLQDNSVMNLEATGNTFTATSTVDTRAAMGIRVGTNSGSATLNATVLSNTFQSTAAGNNGRFSAESGSVGTGTMCLDLRSNTLDGATRLFSLTQSGGTYRVEGAGAGAVSNAAVQSANTVGTGNVSGTVNFNNGANCTQPSI
jgi:hypothetical protein